jgi:multisubunit Na+/H+ antiporter MnhB subunit
MTGVILFASALAALLLAVAIWVVVARTAFTATVGFIVYGLLLALVWVALSAVDVALTEAAIGSGVTGMLLLGASAQLRATEAAVEPTSLPLKLSAGILCILVSAGLAAVMLDPPAIAPTLAPVLDPPAIAPTLAPAAMAKLGETGLGNPVAGVLFAYRALDTLLEKVVVVLALIGVWSMTPDRAWGGVPGLRLYAQPSGTLTLLAQVLPPVGIMLGIYMFWTGANNPGGAFQGGALLAAMWLLIMVARVQPVPPIRLGGLRFLVTIGPFIFLAIGFSGFALAGAFLAYPAGYAKPLIVLAETGLTLSIGVTLALLVAGPAERST